MMQDVKRKLMQLRQERDWTQGELQQRSGIDRRIISSIETGQYPPSARYMKRMEEVFDLRKGDLLRYLIERELRKLSRRLNLSRSKIVTLIGKNTS